MPHISSREEFQNYLITIIIIIIVIIIIIIDYFHAINACKILLSYFGYKWLVCCLTGYYRPNRDDDVYY